MLKTNLSIKSYEMRYSTFMDFHLTGARVVIIGYPTLFHILYKISILVQIFDTGAEFRLVAVESMRQQRRRQNETTQENG